MLELKIYRAPDGSTWQYREGEQPKDYVLVDNTRRKSTRGARDAHGVGEDKQAAVVTKD
jgi:hypothetical protein